MFCPPGNFSQLHTGVATGSYRFGYARYRASATFGPPARTYNIRTAATAVDVQQYLSQWIADRPVHESIRSLHKTYAPSLSIPVCRVRFVDGSCPCLVYEWFGIVLALFSTLTPHRQPARVGRGYTVYCFHGKLQRRPSNVYSSAYNRPARYSVCRGDEQS
ncbi:hypothetical protein CBL_08365 [Carabus blaptoides fortunei]